MIKQNLNKLMIPYSKKTKQSSQKKIKGKLFYLIFLKE